MLEQFANVQVPQFGLSYLFAVVYFTKRMNYIVIITLRRSTPESGPTILGSRPNIL